MLQYYLHISNPGALSDVAWAQKFKQLQDIRQKEAGRQNG